MGVSMLCRTVLVILLVIGRISGQDGTKDEKEILEGREVEMDTVKEADNEKWHAVDSHRETSDWLPSLPSDEEPIMKRRRPGRKRKRRPQTQPERDFFSEDDIGSDRPRDEDRLPPRSRPRRPQRLDTRRDNWRDEMMAEEPFRPVRNYNRRRLYPKYEEEEERATEAVEQIRDPYVALNQESSTRRRPYKRKPVEEAVTEVATDRVDTSPQPTDLKALLKQSGGISLSELLQKKNLSLADLLKGEHQAISALTNIPETTESYENVKQYSGRRRLPPVRKYRPIEVKDTHRTEFESEGTTERRIFVPSHPKYYTSVDYKPNMKELNLDKSTSSITTTPLPVTVPEQTSESISIVSSTVTFSTSENPNIKVKNKARSRLPPTYAKLKNLAKTNAKTVNNTENNTKSSTLPAKAIKINIDELFGVSRLLTTTTLATTTTSTTTTSTEGPMKISFDEIFHKSLQNENSVLPQITTQATTYKIEIKTEKPKEITAKDEIMEIISDVVSRENLTRLLELRNMTLEELVEQRERGSSQRHLADIFHNKTKEPEPSDETIIDETVKSDENNSEENVFDTFPKFNNKNTISLNPMKESHYYSVETKRESRENQFGANEDFNNFINNYKPTTGKISPVWKQAYTNIRNNELTDKYLENDLIIKDEEQRIEEIENKLAEAVNGALNIDNQNYEDENEFLRLPYAVRSAIVASAVIIGISLLVFLTIFIIFKWTQRQKSYTNYTNTFAGSKIKTPILDSPYQRRIFRQIMNATLGRKNRIPTISCKEPHSLQEYLWETDRKPFQ